MFNHDRYQAFCRFCYGKFEKDTLDESLAAVDSHERKDCRRNPASPKYNAAPPVAEGAIVSALLLVLALATSAALTLR